MEIADAMGKAEAVGIAEAARTERIISVKGEPQAHLFCIPNI